MLKAKFHLICCASASALMASAAAAQAAPPQMNAANDMAAEGDIIVTARRRAESQQSVPVAITALGTEQLQRRNITDLRSLEGSVPSVTISFRDRATAPQIMIRGQRTFDTTVTLDPAVGIYFNDVVMSPTIGSNLGFYDLSSLQVVKGPQGTLFGRNTTGGALLLTPVKPGDEFEGYFKGGFARFDRITGEAAVTLPFSERLSVRAAGKFVHQNKGWGESKGGAFDGYQLGTERSENARLSVVMKPADNIEIYTVGYYDHYFGHQIPLKVTAAGIAALRFNGVFDPPGAVGVLPDAVSQFDIPGRFNARVGQDLPTGLPAGITSLQRNNGLPYDRVRVWGVNNTIALNVGSSILGDLTLKNIFGYRNMRSDQTSDFDGTSVPLLTSINDFGGKQVSDEVQIIGSAEYIDWVFGGYYYNLDAKDFSKAAIALPGVSPTNPQAQNVLARNRSYSIYGQYTIKLGGIASSLEGFSLTAGGRYSIEKRRTFSSVVNNVGTPLTACAFAPAILDAPGVCEVTRNVTSKKPTWTFTLDYKAGKDVLLYATARRGFRSGGFNKRAITQSQFVPFKPEIVDDIEGGIKSDWRIGGLPLRLNFAAYRSNYKDIQRSINFVDPATARPNAFVQNAASAKIYGFEVEGNLEPVEGLNLSGYYSYTNASYNEFISPTDGDLSNSLFTSVPKHMFSVTSRYTLPLEESIGDISFQATYKHQSRTALSDNVQEPLFRLTNPAALPLSTYTLDYLISTAYQKGYGTADFRIDWRNLMGSGLDAAAYVTNAFDKSYAVGGIQTLPGLFNSKVYGAPRIWGLELTYRFGEGFSPKR